MRICSFGAAAGKHPLRAERAAGGGGVSEQPHGGGWSGWPRVSAAALRTMTAGVSGLIMVMAALPALSRRHE